MDIQDLDHESDEYLLNAPDVTDEPKPKRYYAEVVVRYSFEFDEEDMAEMTDTQEYASLYFDENGYQGFEFDSVEVRELR